MQYLGGKKRIASQIVSFLNPYLAESSYYYEPFVGSCAVIENIVHPRRYASDKNEYLIDLFKALQNGWIPPTIITEDEYQHVKSNKDENKPLTAFVGIGCSFSGKWFGGYSRDRKTTRNYALNAHNTLLKQLPKIQDVVFGYKDYKDCKPVNALVYCDPPYANTTSYDLFDGFDHVEFWEVMRKWSKNNTVFISEYNAPDDFECVLEIETRTDLKNKESKMIPRIERIFRMKGEK
jgi:DNA adenine methylase